MSPHLDAGSPAIDVEQVDPDAVKLAEALRHALTRIARRIRQADVEASVTVSQLSVMRALNTQPGMTLSELAAFERVQPPTMTRLLAALEQSGMVERQPDLTDRRVVRASLTEAGTNMLFESHRRRNAFLSRRVARLQPDELATLLAALPLLERLAEED